MRKIKKISLLLILLTLFALFGIGIALAASGPELVIPSNVQAQANSYVDIPVEFRSNGTLVSNITFSINYDSTWLNFNEGDPLAVTFSLPIDFSSSDCWEAVSGEIQCIVSPGLKPVLPTVPSGVFLTLRLETLNAPDGTRADVFFDDNPIASFGGPDGQAVPDGSTTDGSVYFGEINWFVFLPLLIKQTPIPTTVTPTPVTPTPVTPTPVTPTPETPTPVTPTPETPTPPPACSNIILNGGFEEPDVAWYLPITNYPARYVDAVKYAGSYSMRTGINIAPDVGSYSSAWQLISIPNDALSAELTFYYKPQTEEPLALRLLSGVINRTSKVPLEITSDDPPLYDRQLVLILNQDESVNTVLMNDLSNTRTWTASGVQNLIYFKGQSVWLYFASLNNGNGQRTAMYIDEVMLEVCR
ncbi:MAG TPA: hypothetical protein DEH22_04375 [Chloroflexi bacterium]|nr:hypothetical protein [Chloroflexota bacterium]